MNKPLIFVATALLLAAAAPLAAEEVGATNPQTTKPVTLAYASAETGANQEWAIGPINPPVNAEQHSRIVTAAKAMTESVSQRVAVELYKSLEADL